MATYTFNMPVANNVAAHLDCILVQGTVSPLGSKFIECFCYNGTAWSCTSSNIDIKITGVTYSYNKKTATATISAPAMDTLEKAVYIPSPTGG